MKIITTCLISYFLIIAAVYTNEPSAKKGYFEVPVYENSIKLDGEWEFYESEFLNTEEIKQKKDKRYVLVPSNLASIGNNIKNFNYGTYYLKLRLPTEFDRSNMVFYISKIMSSYKIFINDYLLLEKGKVSKNKENFVSDISEEFIKVDLSKKMGLSDSSNIIDYTNEESKDLNIVIHVSNFDSMQFGITRHIHFVNREVSYIFQDIHHYIDTIFISAIFSAFFISIVAFVLNVAYFGNISLSFIFSIANTLLFSLLSLFSLNIREGYISFYYASFGNISLAKIEIICFILIAALNLFFYSHFFHYYKSKFFKVIIGLSSLLFLFSLGVLVFLSPDNLKTLFFISHFILLSTTITLVFISIKSILEKKKYSYGFLSASTFLFLASITTILKSYTSFVKIDSSINMIFLIISCYLTTFILVLRMFTLLKEKYAKENMDHLNQNFELFPIHIEKYFKGKDVHSTDINDQAEITAAVLYMSLEKCDDSVEDSLIFSYIEKVFDITKKENGYVFKFEQDGSMFLFFEDLSNCLNASIDLQKILSVSEENPYYQKVKSFIGIDYCDIILNYTGDDYSLGFNLSPLSTLKFIKKFEQNAKLYDLKIVISENVTKKISIDPFLDWQKLKANNQPFTYRPFKRTSLPIDGSRINLYELLFEDENDTAIRNRMITSHMYNKAFDHLLKGDHLKANDIYARIKGFNQDDKSIDELVDICKSMNVDRANYFRWM